MNVLDEERRVPSLDMSLKQPEITRLIPCTIEECHIQVPHKVVHVIVGVLNLTD